MFARIVLAAALLATSFISTALAEWRPGGNLIGIVGEGTRLHSPTRGAWVAAESDTTCLVVIGGPTCCQPDSPVVVRVRANGDTAHVWPLPGTFPNLPDVNFLLRDAVPDGAGGVIVLWQYYAGGWQGLRGHRVTATGSLAPGWPDSGVVVSDSLGTDLARLVADGAGGAFAAWNDVHAESSLTHVRVQHLGASGGVATPGGLRAFLAPGGSRLGSLIADGAGGAIVVAVEGSALPPDTTDLYAQRVDAALARLWGDAGAVVCAAPGVQAHPAAMADGVGGMFVAWDDESGASGSPGLLMVTRLDSDGEPASGWPAGGTPVRPGAAFRFSRLARADGGDALIASMESAGDLAGILHVDRLGAAGTVDTLWHPYAYPAMGDHRNSDNLPCAIVSDGAGGAFLSWNATRAMVLHIAATGQVETGWDPAGVVLDAPITGGQTYAAGASLAPAAPGQAFAVFQMEWYYDMAHGCGYHEVCYNRYPFVQYLVSDGLVGALASLIAANATPEHVRLEWWVTPSAAGGVRVERAGAGADWVTIAEVLPDGSGRVAFHDPDVTSGARYGYRLAIPTAGGVAHAGEVWVDVPGRAVLALGGARPNPSAGALQVAFALPDASPARLDLLDLAGRRVRSREVGGMGAGSHIVSLAGAGRLPPGAYLLRLTQGGRALTARTIVTR